MHEHRKELSAFTVKHGRQMIRSPQPIEKSGKRAVQPVTHLA
jgi:hypothetical protein